MEIGKLLNSSRERLVNRLKKFSYRHSWAEALVTNGVAFQLRALRKSKNWDQRKLAEIALGNSELQSMISRYENPDYGKYNLRTLLDFAKAFDVALVVRFAPFSELLNWEGNLTEASIRVPSFSAELAAGRFATATTAYFRSILADDAGTLRGFNRYYRPHNPPIPGRVVCEQVTVIPDLSIAVTPVAIRGRYAIQ